MVQTKPREPTSTLVSGWVRPMAADAETLNGYVDPVPTVPVALGDEPWPRGETRLASSFIDVGRLAQLPEPFLRIHSVRSDGDATLVVADRFVGVNAAACVQRLKTAARRLPLDVWLGLAVRVLDALEPLPRDHPAWLTWVGPHGFGVDLSKRFVISATRGGGPLPRAAAVRFPQFEFDLDSDWADWRPTAEHSVSAPLSSLSKAFIWLLDPRPYEYLHTMRTPLRRQPAPRWDGAWHHPQVSTALAAALNVWLERPPVHDGTLASFRQSLVEHAGVAPASLERISSVFFGACSVEVMTLARELSQTPEFLPVRWRNGGLLVEADHLLEGAALDGCPPEPNASNALFPATPTSRLDVTLHGPDGGQLRRTALGAGAPFRQRIALPVNASIAKGTALTVTIRHPIQTTATVSLRAEADGAGWAILQPPEGPEKVQLDHLLESLSTEHTVGPSFQVVQPSPERARRRRDAASFASGGGCFAIAGALAGLALALPVGILSALGLVSWWAPLAVFGGTIVLASGLGAVCAVMSPDE